MGRLIDADAAIVRLLEDPLKKLYDHYEIIKFLEDEEECPTVDAVLVTRCKDCKWNHGKSFCLNEGSFFTLPSPDSYCSLGEMYEEQDSK